MRIKLSKIVYLLSLFLSVQLYASACFGEKIPIAVSIFPIADMVKQVGGAYVDVVTIIPAGASPHTFEPRPSLVRKISTSKILFMIGAGLEFWAKKFTNYYENSPAIITLSDGIELIYAHNSPHHNKHSHSANPHIWLDPEIAKLMVKKIITVLCKIDNEHSNHYKRNGAFYLDELSKLHNLICATAEKFKIKKYVAFHSAWDYFAKRYHLSSAGIIAHSPGRNPTPKQIKKIIVLIKQYKIKAVFAEPQLNPKVAQVIAKEANVKVLMLDPIGSANIKNRNTYIKLMKYNLGIFEQAMM